MRIATAIAMRIAIVALVCSLGVAHAQAPAPDRRKAAAAYAEGQRRIAAHDYAAAAAKFIEAYAAEPDPSYLFNVAQSFRYANDCAQAASYYQRFLAEVTSAPNLDKARAYLDEMVACSKRQKPSSPSPSPPPTPSPPPSPPSPPPSPPPVDATAPAGDGDPGATRRHIGIGLGAVGLVAIGVGVWFHHDVGYFERKTQGCTMDHPCTRAEIDHWNDRGHAASIAAIASYSAGAAALIGGTMLYLLGRSDPGDSKEQALTVVPTRGGALVSAGLAF